METIPLPTSRSFFGKHMNFHCIENHKYNQDNRNLVTRRKYLCSKVLRGRDTNQTEETKWPSRSVTLVIITMCTCRTSTTQNRMRAAPDNHSPLWWIKLLEAASVVNKLDLLYMPFIVNHWQQTVTELKTYPLAARPPKPKPHGCSQ